jgi:hypothetical protein
MFLKHDSTTYCLKKKTSESKTQVGWKRKICHVDSNQKGIGVAKLSNKMDYKTKIITRDKEGLSWHQICSFFLRFLHPSNTNLRPPSQFNSGTNYTESGSESIKDQKSYVLPHMWTLDQGQTQQWDWNVSTW